ncbi:Aste57867_18147 [Aphanomyces stellatus]|uniref:Aste57867_18147 protein n=1 Tax=Aphanomyces stellatus TaxID=120398 RepID=A0A485LAX6_9STRA|nr:hypothetical protein As57867_018085 [Aphanomyces stellatus]VFT94885.1 Aste57867_18147 [Aphanomyces stellatus]
MLHHGAPPLNLTKIRVHDTGASNRTENRPHHHLPSPRVPSPRCLRAVVLPPPRKATLYEEYLFERLEVTFCRSRSNQESTTFTEDATLADGPTSVQRGLTSIHLKEDEARVATLAAPETPCRPKSAPKPPTPRQMTKRPHTASSLVSTPRCRATQREATTTTTAAAPYEHPALHSHVVLASAVSAADAMAAFEALVRANQKCLQQAFLTWDSNRDGVLSEQEARDMFVSMGWATALGASAVDKVLFSLVHPTTKAVALDDFCSHGKVDAPPVTVPPATPVLMDTRQTILALRRRYDKIPLSAVFRRWDDEKVGHLTHAMLQHNLDKLNLVVTPDVIPELLRTYDTDHDGALCFEEFNQFINAPLADDHDRTVVIERNHKLLAKHVALPSPAPPRPETPAAIDGESDTVEVAERVFRKLKLYRARIADVFKEMDEDESGVLSYAEFRQGLKHKGILLSEQEFHHLMAHVDRDKNGLVTFQELSGHLKACEQMVSHHMAHIPALSSWTEDTLQKNYKFNFDQLRRKVRAPTRRGRTPTYNTRHLIIGPPSKQNPSQADATLRFNLESNQYGPCPTSPSIGTSEKALRANVHATRQHSIAQLRHGQDVYTASERLKRQLQEDKKARYSPPERTAYYVTLAKRVARDDKAWEYDRPA